MSCRRLARSAREHPPQTCGDERNIGKDRCADDHPRQAEADRGREGRRDCAPRCLAPRTRAAARARPSAPRRIVSTHSSPAACDPWRWRRARSARTRDSRAGPRAGYALPPDRRRAVHPDWSRSAGVRAIRRDSARWFRARLCVAVLHTHRGRRHSGRISAPTAWSRRSSARSILPFSMIRRAPSGVCARTPVSAR